MNCRKEKRTRGASISAAPSLRRADRCLSERPTIRDSGPSTPAMASNCGKFGCGMQLCCACTVHDDGVATRSCGAAISTIAGKSVTTIEGLSADQSHPVQRAWMDVDVPQCGYCQSGQIMSAAALLAKNKAPT